VSAPRSGERLGAIRRHALGKESYSSTDAEKGAETCHAEWLRGSLEPAMKRSCSVPLPRYRAAMMEGAIVVPLADRIVEARGL
jgi:hypothetical protein